eukprot:5842445-Amphidinium_carterae.1
MSMSNVPEQSGPLRGVECFVVCVAFRIVVLPCAGRVRGAVFVRNRCNGLSWPSRDWRSEASLARVAKISWH